MYSSTTRTLLLVIVFLLSISLATSSTIWIKEEVFNEDVCEETASMGGKVYLNGACYYGNIYTCDLETSTVYYTLYDNDNCTNSAKSIKYDANVCVPGNQGLSIATTQFTCYNSFPGYPENSVLIITYDSDIDSFENVILYNWVPANRCYKDWYKSYDSSEPGCVSGTGCNSGSSSINSGSGTSGSGLVFGEPTFGMQSNSQSNNKIGKEIDATFILNMCKDNITYTINSYYNIDSSDNNSGDGGILSTGSYSSGYPVPPTGSGQSSASAIGSASASSSGTGSALGRSSESGGRGSIHGGCSITPVSSNVYNLSTTLYPVSINQYAKIICLVDLE